MKAELDIKPFLKAINEFHITEQQPCCVQLVEWVGLRSFGLIKFLKCFFVWFNQSFISFRNILILYR